MRRPIALRVRDRNAKLETARALGISYDGMELDGGKFVPFRGQVVHCILPNEFFRLRLCRTAIITGRVHTLPGTCHLELIPDGPDDYPLGSDGSRESLCVPSLPYSKEPRPGTWHWPETHELPPYSDTPDRYHSRSSVKQERPTDYRYAPTDWLDWNDVDRCAKYVQQGIYALYKEIRELDKISGNEERIAQKRRQIQAFKDERIAYIEHCWTHGRRRRS